MTRVVTIGTDAEAFHDLGPSVEVRAFPAPWAFGPIDQTLDDDLNGVAVVFVGVRDESDCAQVTSLRSLAPSLPVITLGAARDDDLADHCLEAGTSGHFELPIDVETVVSIIVEASGDTGVVAHAGLTSAARSSPANAVTASGGTAFDRGARAADRDLLGDGLMILDDPLYASRLGQGISALVVDDDEFVAGALSEMLDSLAVDVTVAFNRRAALRHLDNRAFDLIMLDSRLPDLDEQVVLEAVFALRPAPVLAMMSGLARRPPEGALFLLKPLNRLDVRNLVAGAVENLGRVR